MSFERHRVQVQIENLLGCPSKEAWPSFKDSLVNYSVNMDDEVILKAELLKDAEDIFFKGILSLCEAINNIYHGLHSWATVKLYYSVYYFLRCSLALKGYALVRCKRLYLLEISEGSRPTNKSNKKYNSDHSGTINYYKDLVGENDLLQTNTIDGVCVYDWLMEKREIVNYRQRIFCEPNYADFMNGIGSFCHSNNLETQLIKYIKDDLPIYCFDEDHACLALPIKRALLTKSELIESGITTPFSDKLVVLEDLMSILQTDTSPVYELIRFRQS